MPNTDAISTNNSIRNAVAETLNEVIAPVAGTTPATTGEETMQPAPRVANPIYAGVKAKREVVMIIKQMVKCGYFRKPSNEKEIDLNIVKREVCRIYNIPEPVIRIGAEDAPAPNCYLPEGNGILHLCNYSIVSFLHEFRHHMQKFVPRTKYDNLSIEEDARAWSLRVYHSACPRMFESAVKRGLIYYVAWDNATNQIINNINYPETLEEAERAEREGANNGDLTDSEFIRTMFTTAPRRPVITAQPVGQVMQEVAQEWRDAIETRGEQDEAIHVGDLPGLQIETSISNY
jgi:hypothetical protein